MTKQEIINNKNWKGTASREIQMSYIPEYKIGDMVNPGTSWTDGGEFRVEASNDYSIIFRIEENTEGHKVNYNNKKECEVLSCEDCSNEKEILIDKAFKIIDIDNYDEEMGFMTVYIK